MLFIRTKMANLRIFFLLGTAALFSVGCTNAPPAASTTKPDVRESIGNSSPPSNSVADERSSSTAEQPSDTNGKLAAGSLLDGNWKVNSIEFRGQSRQPQPGMPETIEISDGIFNALSGGAPISTFSQMRMVINSAAEPDELELVRQKDEQLESLPCIFKLNGERLEIAMPMVPANKSADQLLPRPTSFDTNTGPFLVLSATRLR